jgi:ketosteroid isomerase-like protein
VSKNLEMTTRGFEAFSQGELEASLSEIHPEVEWHVAFPLPDLPPEKQVYWGHDEVRELWSAFRSVWDELRLEIEEVLHDADDVVVVRTLFTGKGGASGAEVSRTLTYVLEIQDEKLARIRPFGTEEEAFAAAGVERG